VNMQSPIAIFDSGLGGLTAMRQVAKYLPAEDIVYFGDTARVPYGTKSPHTIERFAKEVLHFLLRFEPRVIVAACNTVSATALPVLRCNCDIPIFGVVIPGCAAALRMSKTHRIGVIGTEATIRAGAYHDTITSHNPSAKVVSKACPLLVPIVEEGRQDDDSIVKAVLNEYLAPLKEENVDTVVLGCTHYPLLHDAIQREMGGDVRIVDSGVEVARAVRSELERSDMLSAENRESRYEFYASDNAARFGEIAQRFLGQMLQHVSLVEPGEHFPDQAVIYTIQE